MAGRFGTCNESMTLSLSFALKQGIVVSKSNTVVRIKSRESAK